MASKKTEEEVQNNNSSKHWLFKKGQSGNPNGRTKGSITSGRVKLTSLFIDKTEKEWPALVAALFEMAKNQNMKALALIFEYALVKPISTHIINERGNRDIQEKTKEELLDIVNG